MASILEIPLKETPGEVVEVDLNDLDSLNPEELIDLLTDEQAPLALYRQIAIAYYHRQGGVGPFERICLVALERIPGPASSGGSASTEEASEYFQIGAALVAWYLQQPHLLDQATALINKLERIEAQTRSSASSTISLSAMQALGLCRGVLLLLRRQGGGHEQAESQFKAVLGAAPTTTVTDYIPARIGIAASLFIRADYPGALEHFQAILREWPQPPIRLAIAHCLARLGLVEAARRAYEWILERDDPACLDALVALGTLLMNAAATRSIEHYLPAALKTFKRVYELDKTNPHALNHLGNHFFFKKDYAKASTLLQSAAATTTVASGTSVLAAENAYYLGKLAHLQEDYGAAETHYLKAVTLAPQMAMAQFGLGQMYLRRGDRRNALECFERVLAQEKQQQREKGGAFGETRRLVGLLMTNLCVIDGSSKSEELGKALGKAEGYLRASLTVNDNQQGSDVRIDMLRALAVILETRAIDPSSMLAPPVQIDELASLYRQIRSLNEARFARSLDLLNNLGVLEGSEQLLRDALTQSPQNGTVRFNLARLQESQGRVGEAEEVYRQLLLDPAASNLAGSCHLRLGLCAMARGGVAGAAEAADHFSEAIGLDENDVAAWTLMARSHHLQRALTPARKAYERVLMRHDRHDGYALVALGNIYLDIWRSERHKTTTTTGSKASASEANGHLDRAAEFFIKALQVCPTNAYAANGLGVVAAERGDYGRARQIFQHVSIAIPSFRDALVNLAHCFVEVGLWPAAMHAYRQSAETTTTSGKDAVAVQLYLARCQYLQAKQEHQWPVLEEAIGALERAIALLPRDLPIRYNVALCWQEMATLQMRQFERDIEGRTVMLTTLMDELNNPDEEGGRALRALDQAQAIFAKLQTDLDITTTHNPSTVSSSKSAIGLSVEQLEHRLKQCSHLRSSLLGLIETANAQAAARSSQIARLREERSRTQQLQAERERLAAERLAQERATSEQIRQEMGERMRQLEERFREQVPEPGASRSHASASFINDDDDEESDYSNDDDDKDKDATNNARPRRKRAGRREGSSSENDGESKDEPKKQRRTTKRKSPATSPYALSKDTISSSDDDDGDGATIDNDDGVGTEAVIKASGKKAPLISIEDEY